MDDTVMAIIGVVALQALSLAQNTILGRQVRQSLRPPPPASRGTPVVFEGESMPPRQDDTPAERRRR